jgi:betaine-homocysteine S-methyltransferase
MILEQIQNDVVVGDGGAIFELERRGYVSAGPFTPEAVIEQPEAVRQMQLDFARAGAEVLQAVTYYGHEEKLRVRGLEAHVEELNIAAVKIARGVADEYGCMVAGNLCNTWVYNPGDATSHAETRRQFDQQIASQLPGGCDFFLAETIEYLGEALIAVAAMRAAELPAMVTLGFKYQDRTLDNVELEDAFRQLADAGADIVGINCFRDPARTLPLARRAVQAVSCPVATQPVAYRCSDEKPYFQVQRYEGRLAFPLELDPLLLSRRDMAEYALAARDAGVRFIGSCCGSGPHHVRAMAEALGRTVPGSRYSPDLEKHTIIGSADNIRERDERILGESRDS